VLVLETENFGGVLDGPGKRGEVYQITPGISVQCSAVQCSVQSFSLSVQRRLLSKLFLQMPAAPEGGTIKCCRGSVVQFVQFVRPP
jgi:hypothetical protein